MSHDLLGIYLNDHLAGSTLGVELARRTAGANEGTPYAEFLDKLATEIEEDRDALLRAMKNHGTDPDQLKRGFAWLGEKAGRLKLNGQITGYSPLSRVTELEGLIIGVTGKQQLWRALRLLEPDERPLEAAELDDLIQRAERQRDGLMEQHARACGEAFSAGSREPAAVSG